MRSCGGQRLPRSLETASPISARDASKSLQTKELPRIPDFPRRRRLHVEAGVRAGTRRYAQRPAKAAANRHRMFPSRHRKGRWRNRPTRPYTRVTGRRQGAAIRGRMRYGHRKRTRRGRVQAFGGKRRPLSTELPARVDRGRSRARHGRVRLRMRADGKHSERRPENRGGRHRGNAGAHGAHAHRNARCRRRRGRRRRGRHGRRAASRRTGIEHGAPRERERDRRNELVRRRHVRHRFALAAGSRRRLHHGRGAPEGHGIPSLDGGRRADEGVLRRIGRHHRLAREQGRRVHRRRDPGALASNLAHLRRHGRGFHEALGGGLPKPGVDRIVKTAG